jgi:hypothetical protein
VTEEEDEESDDTGYHTQPPNVEAAAENEDQFAGQTDEEGQATESEERAEVQSVEETDENEDLAENEQSEEEDNVDEVQGVEDIYEDTENEERSAVEAEQTEDLGRGKRQRRPVRMLTYNERGEQVEEEIAGAERKEGNSAKRQILELTTPVSYKEAISCEKGNEWKKEYRKSGLVYRRIRRGS